MIQESIDQMNKQAVIDLSILEQARAEKRIHVFKGVFPNRPSWDTILKVIAQYVEEDLEKFPDRSYLSNDSLENEYLDMRLKCRFWSRLWILDRPDYTR